MQSSGQGRASIAAQWEDVRDALFGRGRNEQVPSASGTHLLEAFCSPQIARRKALHRAGRVIGVAIDPQRPEQDWITRLRLAASAVEVDRTRSRAEAIIDTMPEAAARADEENTKQLYGPPNGDDDRFNFWHAAAAKLIGQSVSGATLRLQPWSGRSGQPGIRDLLAKSLFEGMSRVVMLPRASFPLASRHRAALHELQKRLDQPSARGTQVQLVTGQIGSGKCEVVLRYCELSQMKYRLIWWVRAEATDIDFLQLGRELLDGRGAELEDFGAQPDEADTPQEYAKQWLKVNNDWLIVFDRPPDEELVNTLVAYQSQGNIIAISDSSEDWAVYTAEPPINVTPLSEAEAHSALLEFLLDDSEDLATLVSEVVRAVADAQGVQLYAINVLAALLNFRWKDGGRAMAALLEDCLEDLQRVGSDVSGTDRAVGVTISWIRSHRSVALGVLEIASVLANFPVPQQLFSASQELLPPAGSSASSSLVALEDGVRLARIMMDLEELGLIAVKSDDESFTLHEPVAASIRSKLTSEATADLLRAAAARIARNIHLDPSWVDTSDVRWLPHTQALVSKLALLKPEAYQDDADMRLVGNRLLVMLCKWHRLSGRYLRASQYAARVVINLKRLADDRESSPDIRLFADLRESAVVLRKVGESSECGALLECGLATLRDIRATGRLPERDVEYELGYIYCELAFLFRELGDHAEALNAADAAYEMWKPRLGANDGLLAHVFSIRGRTRFDMGQLQRARSDFERARKIREEWRPGQTLDKARSRYDLGLLLAAEGNLRRALHELRNAWSAVEAINQTVSSLAVAILIELASVYCDLAQFRDATSCIRRASHRYHRIYGSLISQSAAYARLLSIEARIAKESASLVHEESKLLRESVNVAEHLPTSSSGGWHPGRYTIRSAYAHSLRDAGEVERAERVFNELLEDLGRFEADEERFRTHVTAATSRYGLGVVHQDYASYYRNDDQPKQETRHLEIAVEQLHAAKDEVHKTWAGAEVLGDHRWHDLRAAIQHGLGCALAHLGRLDEARSAFAGELELRRSVLGPSHHLVARALLGRAEAVLDSDDSSGDGLTSIDVDLKSAGDILRQSEVSPYHFTRLRLSQARVRRQLADPDADRDILLDAIERQQEVIAGLHKSLGYGRHPRLAEAYHLIATCYDRAEKPDKAQEHRDQGRRLSVEPPPA